MTGRRAARLAGACLSVLIALHLALTLWVLSQNPFARPIVERTAGEARLALERAMAREVTAEWLLPRLRDALAAEDLDRVTLFTDLATGHGLTLPAAEVAAAEALRQRHEGALAMARDCGACAWDIRTCQSLALIGACGLTVEVTPLGDLNALRRAALAWAAGEPVDRIEAGLATVGLAATGAILVSGGTSATAKLGATAIRVGRRLGTVTPGMTRVLAQTVDGLILWDRLGGALRTRNLDEAVDAARLARLSEMAADIGIVYRQTSAAEAIVLLRYADDAGDLRKLARTAKAAGPESRKALEVLGKARTFRLLDRIAGLTLAALALLAALPGLLVSLLAGQVLRLLRAALRR